MSRHKALPRFQRRGMSLSRAGQRLLRRIATRKGRAAEGVVLVEGPHALASALDNRVELLFAVRDVGADSAETDELVGALVGRGVEVHEVSSEAFQEFADTDTPQGVLAVAREPRATWPPASAEATAPDRAGGDGSPTMSSRPGPRILVLDRVQDPGNVGTLIRTAAALAVDRVVVLPGTADVWGARAVRASAGSVFALPVHGVEWTALDEWLAARRIPLIVAHARGADVRRGAHGGGWALLVANEGGGPTDHVLARADAVVAVPLAAGVESLNVAAAGAILMWALGPGTPSGSGAR